MCSMSEREPKRTAKPRRTRTACHTCGGQGVIWKPRAGVLGSSVGTITENVKCKAPGCNDGWLNGIHPPM